jgi:hypothetical protein
MAQIQVKKAFNMELTNMFDKLLIAADQNDPISVNVDIAESEKI